MSEYICPKCHTTDEDGWFNVVGTAAFQIDRNGVEDYIDPEWNDDSPMWCRTCGHGGIVADFTTDTEATA